MNISDCIKMSADQSGVMDFSRFLCDFSKTEVYAYLDDFSIKNGRDEGGRINSAILRTAKFEGEEFIVFFIDKEDSRLSESYAGLSLEHAAKIALMNDGVSGILLQDNGSAWLAIRRQALLAVFGGAS